MPAAAAPRRTRRPARRVHTQAEWAAAVAAVAATTPDARVFVHTPAAR